MKFRQDSTNLCSWILVLALVALSQGFLTCNQVKMADEFGDDSFLLDLDLDEIVQKRASAATPSAGAVKRLKRSPLHALPQNVRMGDKSDPEKELATELDAPQTISGGASTSVVPLVKPLLTAALEKTLSMHFGFNSFRKGQLEVIQAVLEQRDVAVFWATGQGKSLCYQIPALHTGHVGIVVSPLISLMEDQVHKLNGLTDKPLATFLGSGQLDPTMETRALQGEFTLVYVTPEKMLSLGFLDRLSHLHQTKKRLCLVAIDESHCVSEWGHDFRPEYRRLGEIREHPILSEVPMLALTATAIPRVQEDIVSSLGLNHPFMARQSFDRQNLIISVQKKRSGGIHSTLQPLLPKLEDKCSTIIYAPTRDQVTEIASYLSQKLPSSIRVQAYHAGMTTEQRSEAHTNFLVGKTSIICSTVAFGMGIDKPDTRRVWHYGPPKTMEEYYQQIGRAGRDGLPAECLMLVSDGDFDRYKSDFYMKNLPSEAKRMVISSLDNLRNFSLDSETCRRKSLLDFFHEVPSFGERCGTCDTCKTRAEYVGDLERDFGEMGARIVLKSAAVLNEQGISVMEKVIGGNIVDEYRYKRGVDPYQVQRYMQEAKDAMSKRKPSSYFRELVAPLVNKGLLSQFSKKVRIPGQSFSTSYTTYELTVKGSHALRDESTPIMLPVPLSIRELERAEEEKRQKRLAMLEKSGVNLKQIPQAEVDAGEGEVIQAFTKWHSYLESLVRSNRERRVHQLEDLRLRIDAWRMDTAAKYRIAPATVLAEHVVLLIAYAVASMNPGVKVEKEALTTAGVRSREINGLLSALHKWSDDVQPVATESNGVAQSEDVATLVFDQETIRPCASWKHAVYKVVKKTGLASWEDSHRRFLAGEHPQTIAMNPSNGKPIQVSTVVGHILQSLEQGREVPVRRLSEVLQPPARYEWDELERAEAFTGMSVVEDPNTSGLNGGRFTMTELLRPVLGDQCVDTPFNERSDADKLRFSRWCDALKWYMALKRIGYQPKFSSISTEL